MRPATGLLAAILVFPACSAGPRPPARTAIEVIGPSYATMVIDFSASFVPLTQNDRLALRATNEALIALASDTWQPPFSLAWRRIGSSSTSALPLCDVLEYRRTIVGAGTSPQDLRSKLGECVESIIKVSRKAGEPEPYTDVSGGIRLATENWASINGQKAIVILSDMKEDLPKGIGPTPLSLHGEHVLLLHRPGTSEVEQTSVYLARIQAWLASLKASGAQDARALPVFRATSYAVEEALRGEAISGSTFTFINDISGPLPPLAPSVVSVLAHAVAKQVTPAVTSVRLTTIVESASVDRSVT